MTSVLLPTCDRPEACLRVVKSYMEKADHPDNVEFVMHIGGTRDYVGTVTWIENNVSHLYIEYVPIWERGLNEAHIWWSKMAREASGRILFWSSDDAYMMTEHWDSMLEDVVLPEHGYAVIRCNWSDGGMRTTGITKKAVNLLDARLPHPQADSYFGEMFGALKCRVDVPLMIFHDRPDQVGGTKDHVWVRMHDVELDAEFLPGGGWETIYKDDMEKVRQAIGEVS